MRMLFRYWRKVYARAVLLSLKIICTRYVLLSLKIILATCFVRKPRRDFRLPTSDFRLRTSDFWLLTSDFRLPTSDFRLLTSEFRLRTFDFRLPSPTSNFGHLTSDFRLSTFDFLLRTFRLPTPNFGLPTSDFKCLLDASLTTKEWTPYLLKPQSKRAENNWSYSSWYWETIMNNFAETCVIGQAWG